MDLISQKAPDNEYFGNKNVYVSELGIPETEYLNTFVQKIKERIEGALNWGVPYILYWQIYGNVCDSFDDLQSCRGFWIKKPTSELSEVYSEVYLDYLAE